jgi:hypothetical protein
MGSDNKRGCQLTADDDGGWQAVRAMVAVVGGGGSQQRASMRCMNQLEDERAWQKAVAQQRLQHDEEFGK